MTRPAADLGLAAASAFLLALTGCATIGPDYRPPEENLAPFHNAQKVEARPAQGPAAPLDRWWTAFNDPALTRIEERVFAQNLELQAAKERVIQARAGARAAGAKLLPHVDATGQAVSERASLEDPVAAIASAFPGFERDVQLYNVGLGASWEMDLFGGDRRAVEAFRAEAGAAEAAQVGVRVAVAAYAGDAYLQIRGAQARLGVASEQVANAEGLLELVRLQRSSGLATDREVAQAEALVAHARSTIPLLRITLEAQLNRLDVLMGVQPGTYASELASPGDVPAVPHASAGTPDLLRRRPDVMVAERRLAAANARIGAALGEYYPKLSLSGLLGFEALHPKDLFHASTFQPLAAVGVRWRLFDFGRVDAEVENARAATREALLRYRQTMLRAAEDVENASVTLVQLEDHAGHLANQIAALTQSRDQSQEAYQAGLIALTDVLESTRQLLVAEDDLARTRADTARAAVSLYRALGGGW